MKIFLLKQGLVYIKIIIIVLSTFFICRYSCFQKKKFPFKYWQDKAFLLEKNIQTEEEKEILLKVKLEKNRFCINSFDQLFSDEHLYFEHKDFLDNLKNRYMKKILFLEKELYQLKSSLDLNAEKLDTAKKMKQEFN